MLTHKLSFSQQVSLGLQSHCLLHSKVSQSIRSERENQLAELPEGSLQPLTRRCGASAATFDAICFNAFTSNPERVSSPARVASVFRTPLTGIGTADTRKPVQPLLGSAPRRACGTSVPSVKARGSTGTQRHVCERPQGSACICSWEPQLKRRRAEIGSLSHCSAGPSSLGAGARLGASGRLVGCACTSAECRHRVSRSTHLHELRGSWLSKPCPLLTRTARLGQPRGLEGAASWASKAGCRKSTTDGGRQSNSRGLLAGSLRNGAAMTAHQLCSSKPSHTGPLAALTGIHCTSCGLASWHWSSQGALSMLPQPLVPGSKGVSRLAYLMGATSPRLKQSLHTCSANLTSNQALHTQALLKLHGCVSWGDMSQSVNTTGGCSV